MPTQELFERVRFLIDTLFPSPIIMVVLMIPIPIIIGIRFAAYITEQIRKAVMDSPDEKPKREQPVSFFEQPVDYTDAHLQFGFEEPDEVVGFGDDGELIYASEKPKRKNDEVS